MKDLKFIQAWKPCPDFELSYEISNFGEVRSVDRTVPNRNGLIKGKVIKQVLNKKGYSQVRLYKNNKYLIQNPHRLVAKAFIPNLYNKPQVNHIDGNKLNNNIDNLAWVDNSENQKHAYRLGLQPSRSGENNGRSILNDAQVTEIKLLYNSGKTILEISNIYNIKIQVIRHIIYGRTWKSNKTEIIKRDDRRKPITTI